MGAICSSGKATVALTNEAPVTDSQPMDDQNIQSDHTEVEVTKSTQEVGAASCIQEQTETVPQNFVKAEATPAPAPPALSARAVAPPGDSNGAPWRDILMELSQEDPWEGVRRSERPHWRELLEEAQRLVTTPRSKSPQEMTLPALRGDFLADDQSPLPPRQSRVIMFISSTFTDTQAERNLLMRDVYPYLRKLCRHLGLDFGTVDMRWGVKKELTMEHGTTQMCISEVQRCLKESVGPAFLTILGHKYGYRTLPVEIDQSEYEKLLSQLDAQGEDTSPIRSFFRLDTNAVPPVYVLQPRQETDKNWWDTEKKVISLLRKVACDLPPEAAEKYFISITEQEIKSGFLDNPEHEEQVICLTRKLCHVTEERHLHRHLIDLNKGEVDADAQHYLEQLKSSKIGNIVRSADQTLTKADDVLLEFDYEKDEKEACKKRVMEVCDAVSEMVARRILDTYKARLHVEPDGIYDEVLQHQRFAAKKAEVFVGREDLLERLMNTLTGNSNRVCAVYGHSGCGKTALMAVNAIRLKKNMPNATMILRFLGTTSQSGSARDVLYSVCLQLARVYGKDESQVPTGYKDLIGHFQEMLGLATPEQPIVVVLDSLDQLSNEDFGQNLKWLSLKEPLPTHCHVVVSTIPGECLKALKAYLPEENLIQVTSMVPSDGELFLEQMLASHKRTVTPDQRKILLTAFNHCPLPLFLSLAVDIALRWHSYDTASSEDIADDVPGMIQMFFSRLESRFGAVFVKRALAYITCAKDGVSAGELEDILSCDDVLLDDLFEFWMPPIRRVPPLLWIRVRKELGNYLMERGTNGVNAYAWYHRQFWETAANRYLDNEESFRAHAHEALADYFVGRWADGKLWTPRKLSRTVTDLTPRMEDRQVPRQPLVLGGSRDTVRQLNRRRLAELPHHLLRGGDWRRLEQEVASLEAIEAKFEARQGYDLQSLLMRAARQSSSRLLSAISRFVGVGLPHFLFDPSAVYQLACQQVPSSPVRELFEQLDKSLLPRKLSRELNQQDVPEDPCQITMRGHTSGVRCVKFNPKGHMLASTAEDGSLRLWDVSSGAELVTVTGLPGPRYSGLADPYHGERPCCWDREGQLVITGSEDGGLQVWDTNGAQVHLSTPHSAGVTGIDVSPDNSVFVTASKDGFLKVWSLPADSCHTVNAVTAVNVGPCLGCVFSPDGSKLAVSQQGNCGLKTLSTSDWSIKTSGPGYCSMNICIDYSPRGSEIVTAGDDSSITIWDPASGKALSRLTGHRGWIWGIQYNSSGTRLLSASSDRTSRLWDMANKVCLVTFGGHLHRVCSVAFNPCGEDTFVTASLDMCVKVWDYEAVAAGRTPPTGTLHYSIVVTSVSGGWHATCQGWSKLCTFINSVSGAVIGSSPEHAGFILTAAVSPSGNKMVTVDTGHTGAYEEGAADKATVFVCSAPSGGDVVQLGIHGPCSASVGRTAIAVGTINGQLDLFDLETLDRKSSVSVGGGAVFGLTCSWTDDIIATATAEGVKVWEYGPDKSPTLARDLPAIEKLVTSLTFSPCGRYLATAISGGTIHIWDAAGGSLQPTILKDHSGRITDMAFAPSGNFFASSSIDMSMRTWAVGCDIRFDSVFYAPVNQVAFVTENIILIGESTGNKRYIQFEL